MEEIEQYAQRNSWTLDRSAEPSLLDVETRCGGVAAHHRRVSYDDPESGPTDSQLIVLGANLTFIKVRSTFPEERRQEGWDHVHALLRELAAGMVACTDALPGSRKSWAGTVDGGTAEKRPKAMANRSG